MTVYELQLVSRNRWALNGEVGAVLLHWNINPYQFIFSIGLRNHLTKKIDLNKNECCLFYNGKSGYSTIVEN